MARSYIKIDSRPRPATAVTGSASPGHVFKQSKKLMKISCLFMQAAHGVSRFQGEHVMRIAGPAANLVGHDALMQLMVTHRLKANLDRPGVIQCENANPLALLELRPAAWKDDGLLLSGQAVNGGPGLPRNSRDENHLAIAHRLPGLARAGEYDVARQQGAFEIL